jgi:hypothetical protein
VEGGPNRLQVGESRSVPLNEPCVEASRQSVRPLWLRHGPEHGCSVSGQYRVWEKPQARARGKRTALLDGPLAERGVLIPACCPSLSQDLSQV